MIPVICSHLEFDQNVSREEKIQQDMQNNGLMRFLKSIKLIISASVSCQRLHQDARTIWRGRRRRNLPQH